MDIYEEMEMYTNKPSTQLEEELLILRRDITYNINRFYKCEETYNYCCSSHIDIDLEKNVISIIAMLGGGHKHIRVFMNTMTSTYYIVEYEEPSDIEDGDCGMKVVFGSISGILEKYGFDKICDITYPLE